MPVAPCPFAPVPPDMPFCAGAAGRGSSDQRPSLPGGPSRRERNSPCGTGRRRVSDALPWTILRSGASVSLVASPAHTRSHRAVSRSAGNAPVSAARSAKKLAPRAASRARRRAGSSPSTDFGARDSSGHWSVKYSATRPSCGPTDSSPAQRSSPALHSVSRSSGRYPRIRAGRISVSSAEASSGAPCSCSTTDSSASSPARGRMTPCQCGRNRPSAAGGTGSTSRRSLARLRRFSDRSTPASHHSRPRPPGVNSPSSTRSAAPSRTSAARTGATPRPIRAAAASSANGPCVRA